LDHQAKTDATKKKRIDTAIEWIGNGKADIGNMHAIVNDNGNGK
jgi:hypothetical protein